MGPIFNEKMTEKCMNSTKQCMNSNFCPPIETRAEEKKKKGWNASLPKRRGYNLYPNHTLKLVKFFLLI